MSASDQTVSKPLTDKKNPKNLFASLGALGISAIFHIFIFLLVGSVVIFEGKIPPVQFFGGMDELSGPLDAVEEIPLIEEDPVLLDTSISDSELEPDSAPMEAGAAAASIDVITAATPTSAFSLPTGMTGPSLNLQSIASGSGKGKGQGSGRGIVGSIFGKSLRAENLGVILDVSGSAHSYLVQAIEEIDKNFPSSTMIMVVGCGMRADLSAHEQGVGGHVPGKPRLVAYNDRDSEKQYNSNQRSVMGQLEKFYNGSGRGRAEELKKYFKKRDNLYLLYGGDISATHFAFDFLLGKNSDVIYWFADFRDHCDQSIVDGLTKDLRRNNTKLIAHNFMGRPVRWNIVPMVEATGGDIIEVIPGKK